MHGYAWLCMIRCPMSYSYTNTTHSFIPPNCQRAAGKRCRTSSKIVPSNHNQDDFVGFADGDLRYTASVILLRAVSVRLRPPCWQFRLWYEEYNECTNKEVFYFWAFYFRYFPVIVFIRWRVCLLFSLRIHFTRSQQQQDTRRIFIMVQMKLGNKKPPQIDKKLWALTFLSNLKRWRQIFLNFLIKLLQTEFITCYTSSQPAREWMVRRM